VAFSPRTSAKTQILKSLNGILIVKTTTTITTKIQLNDEAKS